MIPVDVFVSYASDDRDTAQWLHDGLLRSGVKSVWMDRVEIDPGGRWMDKINDGLRSTQILIAILTRHSIDPSRTVIVHEQKEALKLGRPVIPVLFDTERIFKEHHPLPEHLKPLNYVDCNTDRDTGLLSVLNRIGKAALRNGKKFPGDPPKVSRVFVGREDDLQTIMELVRVEARDTPTGRKSIAIQGMGGLGKTMIAEELVRRLAPMYPGGVIYNNRAEKFDEEARDTRRRWATQLGVTNEIEYGPEHMSDLLSECGELIAFLDDINEQDVGNVRELLNSVPLDATRIITTRSSNVTDTLGCVVHPLKRMSETDALALLKDRFRNKGDASNLHDYETDLKDLIKRVGGHALALELTVGRCRRPSDIPVQVKRLVESLNQGVHDFRSGIAASAAGKNDSVASSMDVSLRDLEARDKEEGVDWASRFTALGVCPPGARMDTEMILAIWGDVGPNADLGHDALVGLESLALIGREEQTDLYFSHPILRAYTFNLLNADPELHANVRQRYADYTIGTVNLAFDVSLAGWKTVQLHSPHVRQVGADLVDALTEIIGDIEAFAGPETVDPPNRILINELLQTGLKFANAVREPLLRRAEWGNLGLRFLQLGLVCARQLKEHSAETSFLAGLGRWHTSRDSPLARSYLEPALRSSEESGDVGQEGIILSYYGELERQLSNHAHAIELLERALAIHRARDDRAMQAITLKHLGETYWLLTRLDDASHAYEEAEAIHRNAQRPSGQADILNKIGSVNFKRGEYRKAIDLFTQALEIHRAVGNRSMEAEDLNDLGASFKYLKEYDKAMPLLQRARNIHERLGDRRLEALTQSNIAHVLWLQGKYKETVERAASAYTTGCEIHHPQTMSWASNWAAMACKDLGRLDDALAWFEKALTGAETAKGPRELAGILGYFGEFLVFNADRKTEGVAKLERAVALFDSEKNLVEAYGGRRREDFVQLLLAAHQ